MVSLSAIVALIGIIYGYSRKGAEDYIHLLIKGSVIGLVIGLIIAIIGSVVGGLIGGVAGGVIGGLLLGLGGFAVFLTIVVVTVEFVVGAFIGDVLERLLE